MCFQIVFGKLRGSYGILFEKKPKAIFVFFYLIPDITFFELNT